MRKIALLIGVSHYQVGLAPLPAATKDIQAMQRVLQDPNLGGFTTVKLLPNPSLVQMQEEIESTFSDLARDDLILLFFSGHGLIDVNGKFYFATSETGKNDKDRPSFARSVQASFVQEKMSASRCKHQVVILDCCFSGAFASDMRIKSPSTMNLMAQLGGDGCAILTSSTELEYSYEQAGSSDLSVYTHYLVEGIDSGAADLDRDGHISVNDLHQYVKKQVRERTDNRMRPEIFPIRQGNEIIVAAVPLLDPERLYAQQIHHLLRQQPLLERGKISSVNRLILLALREKLGLSTPTANKITTQALQLHRAYLKRVKQYAQVLKQLSHPRSMLDSSTLDKLTRLQEIWELRAEDIQHIEAMVGTARSRLFGMRSRLQCVAMPVLGAGVAISMAAAAISLKLYAPLPSALHPPLDALHQDLECGVLHLARQVTRLFPSSDRAGNLEILTQVFKAYDLALQATQASTIDPTQATWKHAAILWEKTALQLQEVSDRIKLFRTEDLSLQYPEQIALNDVEHNVLATLQNKLLHARAEQQFALVMEVAQDALVHHRQARTNADWKQVADRWQKASSLMRAIPQNSPKRSEAQAKASKYDRFYNDAKAAHAAKRRR